MTPEAGDAIAMAAPIAMTASEAARTAVGNRTRREVNARGVFIVGPFAGRGRPGAGSPGLVREV